MKQADLFIVPARQACATPQCSGDSKCRGMCGKCYDKWRYATRDARDTKKCRNHPDRPVKGRGLCSYCYYRELATTNPEWKERRRKAANARAATPTEKAKQRARHEKYRKRLSLDDRRRRRVKKYGLTLEQYESMYAQQQGVCALCETYHDVLCVDHCHDSGRVRGLLCRKCNSAIGFLGDTEDGVRRALSYFSGKAA